MSDKSKSLELMKSALSKPSLLTRAGWVSLEKSDERERDEAGRYASGGGAAGGEKSLTYAEAKAALAASRGVQKPVGGAAKAPTEPVSVKEANVPHFVTDFARQHPTEAGKAKALKTMSDKTLETAMRLTTNIQDPHTKLFRDLITSELKSRKGGGQ